MTRNVKPPREIKDLTGKSSRWVNNVLAGADIFIQVVFGETKEILNGIAPKMKKEGYRTGERSTKQLKHSWQVCVIHVTFDRVENVEKVADSGTKMKLETTKLITLISKVVGQTSISVFQLWEWIIRSLIIRHISHLHVTVISHSFFQSPKMIFQVFKQGKELLF